MARPYIDHNIDELEAIFAANQNKRVVLAELLEELKRRRMPRAKQLRKEVQAVLEGVIPPPPRPVRPARPEDQTELL